MTGGRLRRIVLGHVLAEHVVVVEEVVRVSGRTSKYSGSFGSGGTAGYAIGEGRTSPWLEAIAGIRERPCPRLGSKPVPAPRTRSEGYVQVSVSPGATQGPAWLLGCKLRTKPHGGMLYTCTRARVLRLSSLFFWCERRAAAP